MAQAFLKGRKFTRHQKKVVDAVFERNKREEAEQNQPSPMGKVSADRLTDEVPREELCN